MSSERYERAKEFCERGNEFMIFENQKAYHDQMALIEADMLEGLTYEVSQGWMSQETADQIIFEFRSRFYNDPRK